MVRVEDSGQGGRRFYSCQEQYIVYLSFMGGGSIAGGPVHTAFVCRVGMAGEPVQEEKGRPGGPIQNISDVRRGGPLCQLRN